jgi:hypothetical protein
MQENGLRLNIATKLVVAMIAAGIVPFEAWWKGKPLDWVWLLLVCLGVFASSLLGFPGIQRSHWSAISGGLWMGSFWFVRQLVLRIWINDATWSSVLLSAFLIASIIAILGAALASFRELYWNSRSQ